MRGPLAVLLVAGLLVGGLLATASGATKPRPARAQAAIARDGDRRYGAVTSRGTGEQSVTTGVDTRRLSVADGDSSVRTDDDGTAAASATARDVDVLDGLVTANRIERSADGDTEQGAVYGLRVDGKRYGTITDARTISFDGGRAIINTGTTGLRVLSGGGDVRIAIAAATAGVAPAPTPSPTPTSTPKPAKTPRPRPPSKPGAAGKPSKKAKRRKAPKTPARLTKSGYAFPVYGNARVADNYGASRAAPITVHEGVDIFAPFGSPVVAVRDGTLSKVGTLPISGNRLWLTTASGDAFFYAHLSSFSKAARSGAKVKAGTVLGFTGNTGDAEPTPPHVHFEVHPGGIEEDSVDPYPIVEAWQQRDDVPPGAWLQRLGPDATERPGSLVTVRDFIAE